MMYWRRVLPILVVAIGTHAGVAVGAPPAPALAAASAPADAASAAANAAAGTGTGTSATTSAVPAPEVPASAPISYSARRVYEQARSQLVQIRTVLKGRASQTSVGSGFFVSREGHIITN